MCGKGGGSAEREAKRARQDEEDRQRRIREGTERINAVFDGEQRGVGRIGPNRRYDPSRTYYTASGEVWEPSGTPNEFNTPFDPFIQAIRRMTGLEGPGFDEARDDGLFRRSEKVGGFDDDFFADRRQSYIDFARPQVDRQYDDAQDELTFSLARAGTTNSSVAGEQSAELRRDYDIALQDITDKARSYETDARNSVEDARANLISQLNATGDATAAANAAVARAGALSQTPAYSPVAGLFGDFTNGLSQQVALERAEAASVAGGDPRDYARFSTGLFGPSSSAVKVGG